MPKRREEGERTLVIGDVHNAPGQTMEHIKALNRYIKATQPDRIVIIGDWVEMGSLSRFDTIGSKSMEGMRIEADIHAGEDALFLLLQAGKGIVDIPIIFTEGNHEDRFNRMMEEHPKLTGLTSPEARFRAYGVDDYVSYREYYQTPDGLNFTHVPHNNMKPIESTYGAQKVLQSMEGSVVYGHTHKLDFSSLKRNQGSAIYALNVGCYIHPSADPAYMKGKIKNWWRGVVVVKHARKGRWQGEFETVSMDRLLKI